MNWLNLTSLQAISVLPVLNCLFFWWFRHHCYYWLLADCIFDKVCHGVTIFLASWKRWLQSKCTETLLLSQNMCSSSPVFLPNKYNVNLPDIHTLASGTVKNPKCRIILHWPCSLSGSHLQPVCFGSHLCNYVVQQQVYFPGWGEAEVPLLWTERWKGQKSCSDLWGFKELLGTEGSRFLFAQSDLPVTLVIFTSGHWHWYGVHFLVSSISQAFGSTASLGF